MNSQQYTVLAREVGKELNAFFGDFCNKYPEYENIRDEYLKKEIHLNGSQFYAGFISGSAKEWSEHIHIPVAIEMVMLWAYKTNRILDKKQDVWVNEENIQNTTLEHDLILSCIFSLLKDYENKKIGNAQKVKEIITMLLSQMAYGFWAERKFLMVKNSPIEDIMGGWEKRYRERNINFNLVYDYAPLIGYSVSCNDFSIIDKYESEFNLNHRFSNVGQTINDLGDFGGEVDTHVKVYQDLFSDIRNGIVTYPVHAMHKEPLVRKALHKPNVTRSWFWRRGIRKLIAKHRLHSYVLKMASEAYFAHKFFFESNGIKDATLVLKGFRMLVNNKYFDQRVVSEESTVLKNRLVLCDINGNEQGSYDKLQAHKEGLLHKAFSVLVYNKKGEMLIQKRAKGKYHSGGLWANTCCSHYVSGENVIYTAGKRLKEEMGIVSKLKKKFSFVYNLDCGPGMKEYEFDTVLTGEYDEKDEIQPNPQEVEEVRWISMGELKKEMSEHQERFAPWFKKILERTGALKD